MVTESYGVRIPGPLVFHCNYMLIFYRFQDRTSALFAVLLTVVSFKALAREFPGPKV